MTTDYYPYGLPHRQADGQPRLCESQELQTALNLNQYRYLARTLRPDLALWTTPDPLAPKYPHINPYTYCASNPILMIDKNGLRPEPYEAALMSKVVYNISDGNDILIELEGYGWTISLYKTTISFADEYIGFKSVLFERTIDGKTEYAYVFAGTDGFDLRDWNANIRQVSGLSLQYCMAIRNSRTLSNELLDNELTFIGHSLGGGLAAAGSMATNRAAITFNPASVSINTRIFHLLHYSPKNITNYRTIAYKLGPFMIGGDPLSILQDKMLQPAPGRTIPLEVGKMGLLEYHKIDTIINFLRNK